MKILITGALGYLGARISEYLAQNPGWQIIKSDASPKAEVVLDITDTDAVMKVVGECRPDAIIHTAAIAHGGASNNMELVSKINVGGTKNMVEAAQKVRARFVFISSVAALLNDNFYGKSKVLGEHAVKTSGLDYLILRPSVIIGFSPNREADITFNKIIKAIRQGAPVCEDDSWNFQPTWIEQVCEIAAKWLKGEFKDTEPVYPVVPETTTRFKICKELLAEFGIEPEAGNDPRYGEDARVGTESLEKNNLPIYKYSEVKEKILAGLRQI